MTKRKATKLFAVVALAAASAAPTVAGPHPTSHPVETTPAPTPTPEIQPAVLVQSVLALFGISLPRTLPNGAPACGNVGTRAARPVDCVTPAHEKPRPRGDQ